jgi:hypothetical protein
MKTYDLYLFAPDGKVIRGWHKFEASDDEAAIETAQALVRQPPVELWQQSMLVKRWETARSIGRSLRSRMDPKKMAPRA